MAVILVPPKLSIWSYTSSDSPPQKGFGVSVKYIVQFDARDITADQAYRAEITLIGKDDAPHHDDILTKPPWLDGTIRPTENSPVPLPILTREFLTSTSEMLLNESDDENPIFSGGDPTDHIRATVTLTPVNLPKKFTSPESNEVTVNAGVT